MKRDRDLPDLDPLATARGIMNGLVFSLLIWGVVVLVFSLA